jgi:ketosteroid isomerase-like protein
VTRDEISVVKALVEGLQRGDADAARAALAPDVEWHPAQDEPEAGAHIGIESVLALWAGWRDAFDNFRADPLEFLAAQDSVVVPFRFTGKLRGTETETTIDETHVYRIRDRKVVEVRAYRTLAAALEAAG